MLNKILALVGVLVFCLAIGFGFYLYDESLSAGFRDKVSHPIFTGPCAHVLDRVEISKRSLAENESTGITVYLKNTTAQACDAKVTLSAPNFGITPREESQSISLPGNGSASLVWILTPLKAGRFDVSISSAGDSQVFGINVTNLLGLTPAQAQVLSYVGTVFGPMLTVPWWYERWKERQAKAKKSTKPKPPKAK